MRRLTLVCIAAALASACGQEKPAPVKTTSPAKPAPAEASFTAADGKTIKLSDFRGKKSVVLLFMRGSQPEFTCYFCSGQMRAYEKDYEKFTAAGAEVLAVLPGPASEKDFLDHVAQDDDGTMKPGYTVPFPVVIDRDFSACKAFHVDFDAAAVGAFPVSHPATVVVGIDGSLLFEHHGKKPGDRPTAEAILDVLTKKNGAATKPVSKPTPPTSSIAWLDYDDGMKAAKAQKKKILLDFYADW